MSVPLMVAGGLKAVAGMYNAEQQRKNTVKGLEDLSKVTPAERQFVERRREIMKHGDPLLNEQFGNNVQTIRQQGQFNRQRSQGAVIQQGLESSVVAHELRRRVDQDVLQSVAEQARKLAMANAIAKRNAENEIEGMNLQTDSRRREALAKIAGIGGYEKSLTANMMRAGNIAVGALSGLEGEGFENYDFNFNVGDFDPGISLSRNYLNK